MFPVTAINALTARWVAALPDDVIRHGTVASGVGIWPLLAILAGAAGGEARVQLAAAVGIDADDGTAAGVATIDSLSGTPGVSAALGFWHRSDLPIREEWRRALPPGIEERFSGDVAADQAALDAWASAHTDGLIPTMPVAIDDATLAVLASALAVSTTWSTEFRDWGSVLRRTTRDPAIVRVTTELTCVRVDGDNGIDVELVIGAAKASPADVLRGGMGVLDGTTAARSGTELPSGYSGPGISVTTEDSASSDPQCRLQLPAFAVRAHHDLREHADVFGLDAVTDPDRGHLPGISPVPLAISQAKQDAMAEFSATGFRTAAVSAAAMMASAAAPLTRHRALVFDLRFDRAFGFIARHRASGLILTAGWIPVTI